MRGLCVWNASGSCTHIAHHACAYIHTYTHWGDTVTVIRPSQASAHSCNVTWSFTFYMTVAHLAQNLCRPCPLSMHSAGGVWEGGQLEGVTQRPDFDLCYCFYATRHCSDMLGFWETLMDAQVMQILCVCIRLHSNISRWSDSVHVIRALLVTVSGKTILTWGVQTNLIICFIFRFKI